MVADTHPGWGRWIKIVFVFLAFLSWGQAAHALSVECTYVPTDGTFRDACGSRYEQATLLVQRFRSVSQDDITFLREQAADLRLELKAIGVEIGNLRATRTQWALRFPAVAWDGPHWGEHRSWTLDRVTAVDAFWTDPSSPSLRFAVSALISGRPTVARPHLNRFDLLADWRPPARRDDFTMSSPASVLPANRRIALKPDLGLDFAFAPHPRVVEQALPRVVADTSHLAVLPPNVTTLISLARLGLGDSPVAVRSTSASPFLRPVARADGPLLSAAGPRSEEIGQSSTRWRVGGAYQSPNPVDAVRSFSRSDIFPGFDAPTHSFLTGNNVLGPGSAWSYYRAPAGYPLRDSRLNVDVRLDEWTFGPRSSFSGLTDTGRSLGGFDQLRLQDARLQFNYNIDPRFSLMGGYIYTRTNGLYTGGLSTDVSTSANVIEDRAYPYLGFDYKLSNNARWNVNIRFYNTPLDMSTTPTGTRSTFNLTDPQVTTEVKVRF